MSSPKQRTNSRSRSSSNGYFAISSSRNKEHRACSDVGINNNDVNDTDDDKMCRRKGKDNSICSAEDGDPRFVNTNPSQPLLKKKGGGIEIWPFVLINISLALINCSSRFHGPVMDQYVYQESARKILGNDHVVTTSQPCLPSNASERLNKTMESLVLKAQDLASNTILHLDLTSYGIGVLSNSLLGAYSSVMNRKLLLFIPTFGYLMRNLCIPTVIFWKLDFNWLFLGYAIDGLCGNASGIYFGSYLYTTDITARSSKRTVGMAILQSLKGLVTASLNIATGHLIELSGLLVPSVISASCVLGSILTIMFLPNRQPFIPLEEGVSKWSLSKAYKSYLIPFKSYRERGKSRLLVLGLLSFFGVLLCHFGITKIRNLFLMNLPFCWGSSRIGWFLFGREMAIRLFVLLSVPLCHGRLQGVALAIFGTVSYIGGQITYTLAQNSFHVLFAPVAAIGQSLPSPIIRGELSRLFEPEVQGPLFAGFAVMESLSFATGALFLQIYGLSLSFFPRLVFVVSGGFSVIILSMLISFHVNWKRFTSTQASRLLDKTTTVPAPINEPIDSGDDTSCPINKK